MKKTNQRRNKRKNRGKDFEGKIAEALGNTRDCVWHRLKDDTMGYKGAKNDCDFIAYQYPVEYCLECKCCYGVSFPFSNISDAQWEGAIKNGKVFGVVAGFIIWFIDYDVTIFINAKSIISYKKKTKRKSLSVKDVPKNVKCVIIYGEKKKVYFEYNMQRFFDYINDYGKEYVNG